MQENIVALSDSLRAIAVTIEDIRRITRDTDERLRRMDIHLDKLEAEVVRQISVQERTTRDIQKLKSEMEAMKAVIHTVEQSVSEAQKCMQLQKAERQITPQAQESKDKAGSNASDVEFDDDRPVMPGAGFSYITFDYLKKLSEK